MTTMSSSGSTMTTISYNGLTLDTVAGPRPETPKQLIATRAVEMKDGWVGQIILAGEIVVQTEPVDTSALALETVNGRIHAAFKRLIVETPDLADD